MVDYSYMITGHHQEVIPKIEELLQKVFRNFSEYKVGRAENPDDRFSKADYAEYLHMIVLYKTSSIDNVMFLEDYFCGEHKDILDNINCGSAGNYDEYEPQYLYVVVK